MRLFQTKRHPVRWYVLDDASGDRHFLVAIYRHLAADSVAMRFLLRCVLNEYYATPHPGDDGQLRVYPPGLSGIIGRGLSGRRRIRSFLRGVRDYGRLRHVHRMRESGASEATEVLIYGSQSFLGERLQAACRDRGVTVNGIFLAALCAALAEMTPLRLKHGRRRGIALASAVDMRVSARTDLQDNFGVYLGQALVVVNDPELYDFVQLLACISAQMSAEKKAAAFTVTDWNLLSILLLKGRFLLKNKRAWYRKVWPLSAGLSNVKVDRSWFLSAGEHILDYVRIAPTGPALPLVLTPGGGAV